MLTTDFKIQIDAPAAKVWQVLWFDQTYRKWAAVFREGSYALTDWKTGSKVQFLIPEGDGIYSIISDCRPNEYMEFEHIGEIIKFKEQEISKDKKSWQGSKEIYALAEKNGLTELTVSLRAPEEFLDFFKKTFPSALQLIKELSEHPVEICIETIIAASPEKVWEYWTGTGHITGWNFASEDWHCPTAENDFREGGKFSYTMAAKDGSFSFDFWGIYSKVEPNSLIHSTLGDGRKMKVEFITESNFVRVIEKFEAETMNSLDLQQTGWQTILNNFKKYAESKK
jgi:uncharacterized protein YndB with AHSA1/START domain